MVQDTPGIFAVVDEPAPHQKQSSDPGCSGGIYTFHAFGQSSTNEGHTQLQLLMGMLNLRFSKLQCQHISLLGEALKLLGHYPLLPTSTIAPAIPTGSNVMQPHLLDAPVDRVRTVVVVARLMTPSKKSSG